MGLQVAFYKGTDRFFNKAVSWWERGPYSHCELVTGYEGALAVCYSASFQDKGVRRKVMELVPDHWDLVNIEVTPDEARRAERWFIEHAGEGYDVAGLVGFVWGPWAHRNDKWFCNEAVGTALGLQDAWRFDPNALTELSEDVCDAHFCSQDRYLYYRIAFGRVLLALGRRGEGFGAVTDDFARHINQVAVLRRASQFS